VLVYDRIDSNRRDTILLLGAFCLILLPAAFYVNELLTAYYAFGRLFAGAAEADPERIVRHGRFTGLGIMLGVVLVAAWREYRSGARRALRAAGAKPLPPDAEPELHQVVEGLCIASSLPAPALYRIDSDAANVFSVGLDPDRASIAVSAATLGLLDRPELEGVVAYELAQIGNHDTRLTTVVAAIVASLWLPLRIVRRLFGIVYGIHPLVGVGCAVWFLGPLVLAVPLGIGLVLSMIPEDPAGALALGLLFLLPLFGFVVAPLAGLLIRSSVAAEQILLADSDAVLMAGNPAALARALAKMSAAGPDLPVDPALAPMMFLDPRGETSRPWSAFMRAHPRVDERIEVLAGMDTGITKGMLDSARREGEGFRHRARFAPTEVSPHVPPDIDRTADGPYVPSPPSGP
jgi:heat shock protein HtpX